MVIDVKINKHLGKYFGETGTVQLDIGEKITVGELLKMLSERCNAHILDTVTNEVELRRYCIVTIGRRFANLCDEITADSGEVKLIPPISGG